MKPAPVPPISVDQITPEWIADRRALIARDGFALRAGAGAWIEIKSLTLKSEMAATDPLHLNEWLRLALPGGATEFKQPFERDAVLDQLTGK